MQSTLSRALCRYFPKSGTRTQALQSTRHARRAKPGLQEARRRAMAISQQTDELPDEEEEWAHQIRRPPRNFLIKTITTMRSAKLSQVSLGYRLIASVTCAEWHAPRTFIGN